MSSARGLPTPSPATITVNVLAGLAGSDRLSGMGGNDVLIGGAGADVLDGGSGTDTAGFFHQRCAGASRAWRRGQQLAATRRGDTFNSIEKFVGTAGADVFDGSASLTGFSADGGGGADTMIGGHGNDVLSLGGGAAAVAVFLRLRQQAERSRAATGMTKSPAMMPTMKRTVARAMISFSV